MSNPSANLTARATTNSAAAPPPAEVILRAFTEWRDELVSTLWYLLGNQEDAQDVAQEAFLRCWKSQENLGEIQNLRAWIFRIGINAAKDLQRSAWRRRAKPLLGVEAMPLIDTHDGPDQLLEEKESVQRLREALHDLRPEEKEVFLLRQNGNLTYEQIAEMSQRPVGTVKTQMRTALQKLRKVLV